MNEKCLKVSTVTTDFEQVEAKCAVSLKPFAAETQLPLIKILFSITAVFLFLSLFFFFHQFDCDDSDKSGFFRPESGNSDPKKDEKWYKDVRGKSEKTKT